MIFLLTYHGMPQPELEEEDVAGAYINCWIEAENFEQADTVARQEIEEMKWRILDLDEAYTVTKEDYLEDTNELEYYEQALIDKQVYVFHTYPTEEKEE